LARGKTTPSLLVLRKGVILSAAKNPGEPSTAAQPAGFDSGLSGRAERLQPSHKYVTVTATTGIAAALVIAALAPPALISHGEPLAAMSIWAFFSKLCHQSPDRTLYLFGAPTAVCLRCLGIYAGAAFGGLLQLSQKSALRWLTGALLLNVIDVAAETLGLHGNLPLLRLLIGATLGIATGGLFSATANLDRP
jgi:uncharacterized membrane protein